MFIFNMENFCVGQLTFLTTASDLKVIWSLVPGHKKVSFKAVSESDKPLHWDLYSRGIRVFRWEEELHQVLYNLGQTFLLFFPGKFSCYSSVHFYVSISGLIGVCYHFAKLCLAIHLAFLFPALTVSVNNFLADMNRQFLEHHAGLMVEPRAEPHIIKIQPSLIKSGDTFNILRLDGLDPLIAWAMGSSTGHTAIALWRDDELFMCESNVKSAYWPVDGVQCNGYDDWMKYGMENDYNVVWVPLDRKLADSFDIDKAWEFMDNHLGNQYGFEIFLTGWLDLNDGNKVCVDNDTTYCFHPDKHLELLFNLIDRRSFEHKFLTPVFKTAIRIFKPALARRAGLDDDDLRLIDVYHHALQNKGINPEDLHNQVELDSYIYHSKKVNGEPIDSDVSLCHVLVCKVFKASGIFGNMTDSFQCGDLSVNDMYRLKIYETN